jgi:hypothetical protein
MTFVASQSALVLIQELVAKFDRTHAEHDLTKLCTPAFAGRRIGTDGHDQAGAWIGETMRALGLTVTTFDFTLEQPVLDLAALPTLDILDAGGTVQRSFLHRREFAEHPRSADCARAITGLARPWRDDSDLRGAWVLLDNVSQGQELAPLVINLDGAARFTEAVWVEPGGPADALVNALDQAGQWLEIPLILAAVGSDNRRYAAQGFPTVGIALGGMGGHTPADVPQQVDLAAIELAGQLLLATIGQLAF